MTDEQQVKALAELDGFSNFSQSTLCGYQIIEGYDVCRRVPDYADSYDAIIPLIQKQSPDVLNTMGDFCERNYTDVNHWLRLSAARLCEALLRATGKWTE